MTKLQDALQGIAGYLGVKGLKVPPYDEAQFNAALDEGAEWVKAKIKRSAEERLRAKLAAEAMVPLIQQEDPRLDPDMIAHDAVAIADAMIAQLGKARADA